MMLLESSCSNAPVYKIKEDLYVDVPLRDLVYHWDINWETPWQKIWLEFSSVLYHVKVVVTYFQKQKGVSENWKFM